MSIMAAGEQSLNEPSLGEPRGHAAVPRLIVVLAALGATLAYLQASKIGGRLAQELTFDDVGYATDAARRMLALRAGGIAGLLADLIALPPHSPFSTGLAMFAFALGGTREIALYAANGVILLAASWFVFDATGRARPALGLLAVATFLASPLARHAVQDFRPDIANGLCTAAMVWWLADGVVGGRWPPVARAGIAFGACLLIKPSFFPHALAVALALAVLAAAWVRLAPTGSPPRRLGLRAPASFLALGAAIAAPYYLLNGRQIFDYMWINTHAAIPTALWSFDPGTPLIRVLHWYLLDRHATFLLLGDHLYLALIGLGAALPVLRRAGRHEELAKIGALLAAALVSFAVIFVGRHKNEFFLASFQSLILLAALVAMARAAPHVPPRRWRYWLLAWGVLLAIATATGLRLGAPALEPETRVGTAWNGRLVQSILDAEAGLAPRPPGEPISVFVGFAGPVSGATMQWEALKRSVPIEVRELYLSDSLADYVASADAADYVILPNMADADFYRNFPSGRLQQALELQLEGSADFAVVGTPTPADHYRVLRNLPRFRRRGGG